MQYAVLALSILSSIQLHFWPLIERGCKGEILGKSQKKKRVDHLSESNSNSCKSFTFSNSQLSRSRTIYCQLKKKGMQLMKLTLLQ